MKKFVINEATFPYGYEKFVAKEKDLKHFYKKLVEPSIKEAFPKVKKSQYPTMRIGQVEVGYFGGKILKIKQVKK